MRFVLVLLICHQVGHDSNLASTVINVEQVSSELFLAARAVVESSCLLKTPWNDFTSDAVCAGICTPAVCLQASWLCWHVFPVICHLCLLWQACYQCLMAGRAQWQQSPVTDSLASAGVPGGPCPWPGLGFPFATPLSCAAHLAAAILPSAVCPPAKAFPWSCSAVF